VVVVMMSVVIQEESWYQTIIPAGTCSR